MEYAIGAAAGLVLGFLAAFVYFSSQEGFALSKRSKSDTAFAAKLKAILAGADIKPIEPPKPRLMIKRRRFLTRSIQVVQIHPRIEQKPDRPTL